MNRKSFLKGAFFGGAAAVLSPARAAEAANAPRAQTPPFPLAKGEAILFTGDSVTDGFRERRYYKLPNHIRSLGNGYVELISVKLNYRFAQKQLSIYNTGVSGDTLEKMLARVQADCIALKPSVVSVLAGADDFEAAFTATGKGDPARFEAEYRQWLSRVRGALPNVRFVIGEPYALRVSEKIDKWYPDFEAYCAVAKRMAGEFGAVFIPYQSIFAAAAAKAPPKHFSLDGIHPHLAGVRLMCEAWLNHVNPQ